MCLAMLNVVVVVFVVLVGGRGLGTRFSLKREQTVRKFSGKVSENCLISEKRTIYSGRKSNEIPFKLPTQKFRKIMFYSSLAGNFRKIQTRVFIVWKAT